MDQIPKSFLNECARGAVVGLGDRWIEDKDRLFALRRRMDAPSESRYELLRLPHLQNLLFTRQQWEPQRNEAVARAPPAMTATGRPRTPEEHARIEQLQQDGHGATASLSQAAREATSLKLLKDFRRAMQDDNWDCFAAECVKNHVKSKELFYYHPVLAPLPATPTRATLDNIARRKMQIFGRKMQILKPKDIKGLIKRSVQDATWENPLKILREIVVADRAKARSRR